MRLLSCHIYNFGKLSEVEKDFTAGLNSFLEDNGQGKTTLAVFVKVMLYGFPQKGKRSVDENDRKHYTPWQGGVFGVTLDFHNGKQAYRIRRTFGKTPAEDTFSLLCLETDRESNAYGENVGLALFGMDADAYERSTYLSELALPMDDKEGVSLSDRLTALAENAEDAVDYDKARALLEEKRKYYKKQGGHGYISELEEQHAELLRKQRQATSALEAERQLHREAEAVREGIAESERRLQALRADRVRAEQTQTKRHLLADAQNRRNVYLAHKKAVEEGKAFFGEALPTEAELSELERLAITATPPENTNAQLTEAEQALLKRFEESCPTEADLTALQQAQSRLTKAVTEEAALLPSREELARLEQLRQQFAKGVPTAQALQEQRENCRKADALAAVSQTAEASAESRDTVTAYEKLFESGIPTEEKGVELKALCAGYREAQASKAVAERDDLAEQRRELLARFGGKLPDVSTLENAKREAQALEGAPVIKATPVAPALLAVGAVTAIAGAALLPVLMSAGVALLAVGAVLVLAGLLVSLSKKGKEDAAERTKREKALQALLASFGVTYSGSYSAAVAVATEQAEQLRRLLEREEERQKRLTEATAARDSALAGLIAELTPYGISRAMCESAPEGAVEQLLRTAERYEAARKEIQTADARQRESTEELTALRAQTRAFLSLYGSIEEADAAALHKLETEAEEYRTLCEKLAQTDKKREEKQAEIKERQKAVLATLTRFDAARDIAEGATDMTPSITALVSDTSRYRTLKESLEDRRRQDETAIARATEAREALGRALSRWYDSLSEGASEALPHLRERLTSYKQSLREEKKAEESYKTFLAEKALTEADLEGVYAETEQTETVIAELQAQIEAAEAERDTLKKEQASLEQREQTLTGESELLTEYGEALLQNEQELANAERALRLVTAATTCLEQAHDRIRSAYTVPMKERFAQYMRQITGNTVRPTLTPDLRLKLEQVGIEREVDYFSAGYKSLVDFCMRIALTDTLFEGDKPPLILDDPFSDLDDTALAAALALVKELANRYQILYFTCHSARKAGG